MNYMAHGTLAGTMLRWHWLWGGWAERVADPADVGSAILRARKATEDGQASLLEFITSEETAFSYRRPFG